MAEENRQDQELEKIDIMIYIDDAWRGIKKLWFVCILIIGLCGGLWGFRCYRSYQPQYQSYTTFVIHSYDIYEGEDNNYYDKITAKQMANAFPAILKSSVLYKQVCKAMGEDWLPEIIQVSTESEDSPLLTITVTSADPQRAYDVLQAVIENYHSVAEPIIGATQMEVMDENGVPSSPSNPRDLRGAVEKGGILGACLCILMLMFYVLTRKTVRKDENLKRYLNLKQVGSIPVVKMKVRSGKQKQSVLFEGRNSDDAFNESLSAIRNRVTRAMKDKEMKTLLVTSSMANEGKTTVAVNLAIALAKKKKNVILLDGDLRNPSVHKVFDLKEEGRSMAELMENSTSEQLTAYRYRDLPLMIIMGDSKDKNGQFKEEDLARLIDLLKTRCDYIIIDTPPVGIVSDSIAYARLADAALLVVRQDFSPIDRIIQSVDSLNETGVGLIGYVMNRASVGITGTASKGDYGYGYGYGYGKYGYGSYSKYGSRKKYGYGYGGYGKEEEGYTGPDLMPGQMELQHEGRMEDKTSQGYAWMEEE